MTKKEAEMLAKNWRLGNKFRKKSLTKKYDLKPASSPNTGRVKMGIRIDIENNPKDYRAALDDDGSLIFFTGKPMRRVQVSDLFVPPKATKKEGMENMRHQLKILETILPKEDKETLSLYLESHPINLKKYSILNIKETFKSFKSTLSEKMQYQLVAMKKDGTELKSKFYNEEEELADMQQKCEDSDDYESTIVMKRIIEPEEGKEDDNPNYYSNEKVNTDAPSKLSSDDRKELYRLTTLALKQIPHSPKQKETIKKINQIRLKANMSPLKEKEIDVMEEISEAKEVDNLVKAIKGKDNKSAKTIVSMLNKKGDPKKIGKEFKKLSTQSKDMVMAALSAKDATELLQNGEVMKQLVSMYDAKEIKMDGRRKDFKEKIKALQYQKQKPSPFQVYEGEGKPVFENSIKIKYSEFTLNNLDSSEAGVATALAKKAGVFMKTKKGKDGMDLTIQGTKERVAKFIKSLPESVEEAKMPPMKYAIYDKKTKEVYAANSQPFDKFKMDDVADDMKVKKSNLVMKKMKKGQKAGEQLKEDSKMGKQSDSQLKDLMKKMRDLEKKDPKAPSTQSMIKRIEKEMKKRKITESNIISENKKALQKKADKTGISYSILKKVYDRGMAAWRTGHRPGTSPQQWGMARVNSFATKSKGTWGGADKDLAAKVRGKK